jgi:hypothetical protein
LLALFFPGLGDNKPNRRISFLSTRPVSIELGLFVLKDLQPLSTGFKNGLRIGYYREGIERISDICYRAIVFLIFFATELTHIKSYRDREADEEFTDTLTCSVENIFVQSGSPNGGGCKPTL